MATCDCNERRRRYEDGTIRRALRFLENRLRQPGEALCSPDTVREYLVLRLAGLEHEVFAVLFLDVQNRVLAAEELFRGSLTQTSVYPREVVKRALALNAAAVILAHNHPGGSPFVSMADIAITRQLENALKLVDVRMLDHCIVAGRQALSFMEMGWAKGYLLEMFDSPPRPIAPSKRGRPRKTKTGAQAAGA